MLVLTYIDTIILKYKFRQFFAFYSTSSNGTKTDYWKNSTTAQKNSSQRLMYLTLTWIYQRVHHKATVLIAKFVTKALNGNILSAQSALTISAKNVTKNMPRSRYSLTVTRSNTNSQFKLNYLGESALNCPGYQCTAFIEDEVIFQLFSQSNNLEAMTGITHFICISHSL